MVMDKAQLVALLHRITDGVLTDDTFEGSMQFVIVGVDKWEVEAAYRVGNTCGQGGMVLIAPSAEGT